MTLRNVSASSTKIIEEEIHSLCPVNVEEIGVQDGLNDTCNDCDRVIELGDIEDVAVDPIGDVQCSVSPKRKEVVCRDRFSFSSPLQHEELGQNCNRLQPN